jgi:hypothetical protein
MLKYRVIIFLSFITILVMDAFTLSAQVNDVRIVEENQEKKYTQIKTGVFKNDATILKDTTNEFNRYPSAQAVRQYIPSLSDIQRYEAVLKNNFVSDGKIINKGGGEMLAEHYRTFNRQYSGYIDKAGDTILVVCFLDFSDNKKAKIFFYNWKYQNEYLSSGLFLDRKPPHIYCYAFNLRKRALSRYTL